MPQGLRGRVALFGAGVVCCSGLVGCLGSNAGKAPPVSKAKNGVVTPPGARTTVPDIRPVGGSGIPVGGGFQPGVAPPPGGFQPAAANPNYTGGIGGPTTPGNYGPGAPLPGNPPTVPSVGPAPSNYPPPVGGLIPANQGSSNVGAMPTTARGVAPVSTPPMPTLAELQPPPPPGGIVSPADAAPPTAPLGYTPPLAPAPPNAPR